MGWRNGLSFLIAAFSLAYLTACTSAATPAPSPPPRTHAPANTPTPILAATATPTPAAVLSKPEFVEFYSTL